MTEQTIEMLLRSAPKPQPPPDLKGKLLEGTELPVQGPGSWTGPRHHDGWLKRWWPALIPAGISVACAAVLTMQQTESRDARKMLQALSPAVRQGANAAVPAQTGLPASGSIADSSASDPELVRLREQAARLRDEVTRLEQLQSENDRLRTQLAAPVVPELSAADAEALAKAREKAMAVACANNLKQLGLAAKVYSLDNTNRFPDFVLEMTNEMSTPKILVCPADTGRQAPSNFIGWTTANMSYEYLAPGATDEEPQRVLFRCPIHGHIGLCDGSVQMGIAKTHPESLVQRDGKLYLNYNPRPGPTPPPAVPQPESGGAPSQ